MDTVITVYVDLHENFVQGECTCDARQRFTLPLKQSMFFVLDNYYMHFTSQRFAVGIRIPQRCVVLKVDFLSTVWQGIAYLLLL